MAVTFSGSDGEVDEIEFPDGTFAQSGSAFVTRSEKGTTWGGDARTLRRLENPDDVAGLVVFDTWIRNRDRHAPESMERVPNYNNVFLSNENTERRRLRLLAIDHTHCFATGDLSARLAKISNIRDPEIYGLFPGFQENLRFRKDAVTLAAGRLANVNRNVLESIIGRIPQDWDVTNAAKNALEEFLYRRAEFVASNIVETLTPMLWPQQDLPFPPDDEGDE